MSDLQEVMSKEKGQRKPRAINEDSVMGKYRSEIAKILKEAEGTTPPVTQMRASAVANVMIKLFEGTDDKQKYNRSYSYLRHMDKYIQSLGWEIAKVENDVVLRKADGSAPVETPAPADVSEVVPEA